MIVNPDMFGVARSAWGMGNTNQLKTEVLGDQPQAITPVKAGAGSGAKEFFGEQGKDLAGSIFGALGDRVGAEIRGDKAGAYGGDGMVLMQAPPLHPAVIGGMVLTGVVLVALVLKK